MKEAPSQGIRWTETTLSGVRLFEPRVFADSRGYLFELWNSKTWAAAGMPEAMVQDNISVSKRGVLRGLHLQHPHGQRKIVSAIHGEILDVVVDVRVGSPTFGKWYSTKLSSDNHRSIVIPEGFAHGFSVLSEEAVLLYKFTEHYRPGAEIGIAWDDPDIGIEWPAVGAPLISEQDRGRPSLGNIDPGLLPAYVHAPGASA